MRESLKDKGRLEHMLDHINMIQHTTEGYSFEKFCDDPIRNPTSLWPSKAPLPPQ